MVNLIVRKIKILTHIEKYDLWTKPIEMLPYNKLEIYPILIAFVIINQVIPCLDWAVWLPKEVPVL